MARKEGIEETRELFINPRTGEGSELLGMLTDEAMKQIGQIYAHRDGQAETPRLGELLTAAVLGDGGAREEMVKVMNEVMDLEAGTRLFHERFAGQIHPWGSIIAIWCQAVGAALNTNRVVKEVSPVENMMEQETIDFMAQMIGYKEGYSGNLVTGGTEANIIALWVAREKAIEKLKSQGRWIAGEWKPTICVLGTEMAHYSVEKACDLMGLKFVRVEMKGWDTDPLAVANKIDRVRSAGWEVAGVVGLAGGTETGQVDNLRSLAAVCKIARVHFHVDAAYGGPFILSEQGNRFDGINAADSVTIDPHKMMYVPYTSGAIVFKDAREQMLVEKGMKEHARYLLKNDEMEGDRKDRNFGMSTVAGSMAPGGVIATWATIKLFGRERLATILNYTLEITRYAEQRIKRSDVLRSVHPGEAQLNTLQIGLKRRIDQGFKDKQEQGAFVERIRSEMDDEGLYISSNGGIDHGYSAFRTVWMNPFTTTVEVEEIINRLEEKVRCR